MLIEMAKNACSCAAMVTLGLANCARLIHHRREGRGEVPKRLLEGHVVEAIKRGERLQRRGDRRIGTIGQEIIGGRGRHG